jgi:HlyD family secretion protein
MTIIAGIKKMKNNYTDDTPDILKVLGDTRSLSKSGKWKKWVLWGIAFIAIIIVAVIWVRKNGDAAVQYATQSVQSGDLMVTVSATGNLQPTNQVEVGSELSGIVDAVEVDYNDHVTVGQILARLDTSRLEAQVLQSEAALAVAKAKVKQIEATIREARSTFQRLQKLDTLSGSRAVSQNDLEVAEAVLLRALADKASAEASVEQARAILEYNQTDLAKNLIHSPVNGIVLVRSVEVGQTVAASLQAPVLFTLAEDLARMELHVDVDEADVGRVKVGQRATFTVDAYPERSFAADIIQVRYGSKTVDGVVTYETILNVDNSELLLRPGMTATADIVVLEMTNAILIPNAALRFSPPVMEEKEKNQGGNILTRLFFRRRPQEKSRNGMKNNQKVQRVWTLVNRQLSEIPIKIGVTDGVMTEVIEGNVQPGMKLVTDIKSIK